jgi:SNF2 family DNA or RNA helicase
VFLLKHDVQKTLKEWDELGITEKNIESTVKIGKYSVGLLREASKGDFSEFRLAKEIVQMKKSLENFSGIKKYPLPEDATVTLRDYQHTGYNWLRFLQEYGFSGILADDMGLGKTIQTLAFLQSEHDRESTVSPTLIVVPTSLVLNWMDEAQKFVPKLRIQYVKDGKTGFSDIRPDTQIIIASYGIVANLVEAPGFESRKFHYVILDEAQNIKNLAAARTKSVLKLRAAHRLALSGTPIENHLMELFSIFNFLMPGFVGSESSFREKYAKGDAEHLEILSRKVKPFILRRKKEDVLKELPAKQEEVIYLEMGAEQKKFYDGLKTAFKAQITQQITENGLAKSQFAVLDALLKLRQACLMPRLVKIEDHLVDDSIKLDYIEENIEEMIESGHNLLIFSQFTGFLAFVRQTLERKGIPYHYLDGATKREDRKKLVDGFNAGAVPVFLISLKAGGTGLNLTGADYVIHLDPWWNPAVESQATDRAHRMGQTKTVFVQKLIVRDTVEEKILRLQAKKKKLVDDLFSGDFRGSLSEEDIGYIFE